MSKFTPTPAEVALVNQIFTQADTQKLGVITGDAAVKIFNGSKLTPSVLAEIWNLADEDNNGVLTRKGVAVAVRLLGHAQRGEKMTEALVLKPGPAPTIEGLSPPLVQQSTGVPAARSPPPGLPSLTPQDKTKFMKLFLSCGPANGILNGDKARDVFVKSKLPVDKLSQIWNLADTKNRGSLDVTDFTIAMYLIQATMHGQLQTIPPVLPPGLYEQAAGKSPFDGVATHATGSSGHYSPGLSAAFPGRPMSMMEPNFTGQASTLQPQMTGPMRSAVGAQPQRSALSSTPAFPFVQPQATGAQWDVTPAEKANADRIFDTLDTQKRGYIEGDVAVPFMLLSKLQEDVLAQVWDLADLSNDGHLTRDGFAVAMHLIQGKLNGRDIPAAIPPGLIPPSMRGALGAPPAPAVQPQQTVPDAMRDLLWDDSPPASATVPQPQPFTLQPQSTGAFTTPVLHPQSTGARQNPMTPPPQRAATVPSVTDPFASANSPFAVPAPAQSAHRDLLGDDDEPAQAASPPLQDRSAEIGNAKNQLSSTNRSLETAKTERESMERTLSEQAAQLSALQTQLSSAKAAYETETRLLGALRERYSNQTTDIQKTREELIRAESDLSAVRVEKAEVEGAVLRDKEEVRDLQRRMTEVGMEVETLKVDVEKAKKEAKQQKGLLAIAKKQLATRETERARVQKELGEAQTEAAEATREREQAEAELEKEVPAAMTNGHGGVASPDILAMAAAQPLPATPEVPTSPTGSVLSLGKSNNPFERVAMASGTGSRAQSPSPFLPFTNTGNLPTPPTTVTESPVQQSTPVSAAANPFRFSQAFSPVEGGSLLAAADAPGASDGLSDLMSPTDTDMFHTPLSSATGVAPAPTPSIEATLTGALSEPAAAPTESAATTSIFDEPGAIQATTAEATQEPADIREETDLSHQLKELDVEESDSDSESEEEPLANVKARLSGEAPHTDGITESSTSQTISAFDDSFGISAPTQDARPGSSMRSATGTPVRSLTPAVASAAPTNAFDETFAIPAVAQPSEPFAAPVPIPTTAAPQTNGDDPGTPGVNDFDEAMGKLGASTSSNGGPSQFSEFSFDSAFDDNFDFAAASAATSQPAAPNGNGHAAPAAAPADNAFDNVFMSQPSSAFPPVGAPPAQAPAITGSPFRQPATQETRPFSFDDAFSAGPSAPPAQSGSNGSVVNAISFDDAFGGQSSALALDTSFGTTTSEASAAPSQVKGPTPFPTASPPQSPTGPTSPGFGPRRSTSPPRHLSPPPRHSSPKPNARPSTAGSEKEKAPNTRHSKLSIRLPFGRKKKTAPHEIPPLPSSSLATQQVLEEPTPAVEDDIDAVKQLCGMGFSRTQAVMALENHGYDVQRALNSLLGS